MTGERVEVQRALLWFACLRAQTARATRCRPACYSQGKSWSPARPTYVSHVDDEENFKCFDCLFVPAKL